MNDESDDGWRQSEADGRYSATDVHGRLVRRTSHGDLHGGREKNLQRVMPKLTHTHTASTYSMYLKYAHIASHSFNTNGGRISSLA